MIRTPRNVLLITIDALRSDEFDPIQNALPSSNTTILNRCIATGPGTSTAFPGILTSTYPFEYTGYEEIGQGRTSVAESLADAGFDTAGFHSNPLLSRRFGYDRGFDTFYDSIGSKRRLNGVLRRYAPRAVHDLVKRVYYRVTDHQQLPYDRAASINARALNWLETRDSPWFCWVHYMDPHHPYKPPSEYTTLPKERIDRLWKQLNDNPTEIPDSEVKKLRDLYRAEVEYLADSLADFFERLEREGLLEETLVIITADHGEEFRDHGDLLHKPKLHRELVEIPLLLTGECVDESVEVVRPISSMDVPTTILDVVGEETPASWRGTSILDKASARSGCFSELSHTSGGGGEVRPDRVKVAYRTENWTFIHDRQAGEDRLYDRRKDLSEREDVSEEREYITRKKRTVVDDHLENVLGGASGGSNGDLDDSIEERLADLGYK